MGAIVDILHIDREDLPALLHRYPDCVLLNQTNSNLRIQKYRIIIPGEDQYDDSYYIFLLEHSIAMCSRNFQARIEYDEHFKKRIRARVDAKKNESGQWGDIGAFD